MKIYNGCVGKLVTPADCKSVATSSVGSSPTAPTNFKILSEKNMTLIEKAIIAIGAILLVGIGATIYVIAHFLAKVW